MANLSDILPEVRPDVIGCPEPQMINAIRNAVIKFCEESHFWEVDLTPLSMAQNVPEYVIIQPANQRVIRISQIIGSFGRMAFRTEDDMDALDPKWRTPTGNSPKIPVMINPRLLRMYPIPNVSGEQLTMKAIVKPSPTATVIDDYIYDDFYTGIAAGAKAILTAMPNKEWTNFELVPYYQSLFNDDVCTAKTRVARGYSNAPLRTRPVRTAV